MAKRSIMRFLKQDVFFEAIAHGAYAHSLITFLCDADYSTTEHEFVLELRDLLSEELNVIRDLLLGEFLGDDESILECQNYVKEHFGVGLEIFDLTSVPPVTLRIVDSVTPMIEPHFLTKEEVLKVVGHSSVAFYSLMEMDSFFISNDKKVEQKTLPHIIAILRVLLPELSAHPPLIPLCEEFVMSEYEIGIPFDAV